MFPTIRDYMNFYCKRMHTAFLNLKKKHTIYLLDNENREFK